MVTSGAAARSTLSASAVTSGPMPSPPMTASLIVREPMPRTLLAGRACRGRPGRAYLGGRVAAVVAPVQRDLHRADSWLGLSGVGALVPGIHVIHEKVS